MVQIITWRWNGRKPLSEVMIVSARWRHQMKTFSALLDLCARNSPVTGEFPSQMPVTQTVDVFICAGTNGWVKNRDAGNLRRHRAHYDVTVMVLTEICVSGPRRVKKLFLLKRNATATAGIAENVSIWWRHHGRHSWRDCTSWGLVGWCDLNQERIVWHQPWVLPTSNILIIFRNICEFPNYVDERGLNWVIIHMVFLNSFESWREI